MSTGFDHKEVPGDEEASSLRGTRREKPMQKAQSKQKGGRGDDSRTLQTPLMATFLGGPNA